MNDTRETGRSQRVREVSFSALLLAPTLLYPFGRDQGVFAYVGRLILRGGAPYADVMEQKGPLLHYAYALAMGMFGQTEVGVRTFFLLVSTLGALLAAELAERAMGRGARLGAALGYAAVVAQYHTLGHWHSAQAEDLIALLLLAALLALTRLPASRAYSFAAGVCFGLAILAKSTAAIECGCVALVSLWAAWSPRSGRARRIAELTCATSLGALIVIGGALGYLAWRGALD